MYTSSARGEDNSPNEAQLAKRRDRKRKGGVITFDVHFKIIRCRLEVRKIYISPQGVTLESARAAKN